MDEGETVIIQKALKGYYMWPRPFGDLSKEVLKILALEMHAPGASMKNMLTRIYPDLQTTPTSNRVSTFYFMGDEKSRDVRAMLSTRDASCHPTMSQVRYFVLSHTFSVILQLDPSTLNLEFISDQKLFHVYKTVSTLLERAITIR